MDRQGQGKHEVMYQYITSALRLSPPGMHTIQQTVKEAGLFIVFGCTGRDGGSLHMAQSFIDSSSEILHHRRKIKPNDVEWST